MATRSTIAKLGKDGIIKAVYCHSDGYLEHNGKVLNEYYKDESKVDELLAHGDISFLNKNIGEKLPFNDYMLFHEKKQCRFYHRDRGEDKKEAATLKDENELIKFATEKCDAEYIYMFAYGSWYVYDVYNGNNQFEELEEELYVPIR